MKPSKTGILTWHSHGNAGGNLQAFALQTVPPGLGYDAEIIDYRPHGPDRSGKNGNALAAEFYPAPDTKSLKTIVGSFSFFIRKYSSPCLRNRSRYAE